MEDEEWPSPLPRPSPVHHRKCIGKPATNSHAADGSDGAPHPLLLWEKGVKPLPCDGSEQVWVETEGSDPGIPDLEFRNGAKAGPSTARAL